MTDYFEVHTRDGAARLGELRLEPPITTPALVGDRLADSGSLWAGEHEVPEGSEEELTILPHRGLPGGTPEEVRDSFVVEYPDVAYPSAAVISSASPEAHTVDAYLLSDVKSIVGHGESFVEGIVAVREAIQPDTALILSGIATPRNVATLIYAGVDAVDAACVTVEGTRGRYLTTEGDRRLSELEELPCACPACRKPREEFTREDCAMHNENALRAELAVVRRRIREGRLRDYVEGQARHNQWLTATVRELDDRWGYVEERAPILREAEMTAATGDTIRRPEIRRYADRVTTRYRNRFSNPLVLVPCSARKPYSESKSHSRFHDAIGWRAHLVSMTSPIGVVPQELETTYPAQHYDTVVTGRWTEEEKEFVVRVLCRYLERNEYPEIVAHVPSEGYREIVERVEADRDLAITYTVPEGAHPTDENSLENLAEALAGELKYSKREREHNTVRAIADYIFGEGAGDELFPDLRTTGRYPKLQVRDGDETQLATMVPHYGTLSLTLEGARRWVESSVPTKRVEIDSFVPHGSVLAPGVVSADPGIRVGDEVVVAGPEAFAVGRAEMFGREMEGSTRGVACEVRHVEEI